MRRILLSFLLILFSFIALGQDKDLIENLSEDGEYYLEERQYEKAYYCFNKLINLDKKNELFWKLKKASAATHIPAKKDEAITLLEEIRKTDSTHYAIDFHLGEAYHHAYKFDEAIFYLQKFVDRYPESKEFKEAELSLLQAKNGKKVTQMTVKAEIKNLGEPVNSEDAEYVPVISADESILIYTYRGKRSIGGLMDENFKKDPEGDYYEDIFITRHNGQVWDEPQSIGDNINTKHNDAAIALSPDGTELYTFSSTKKDGGDIYVCRLNGEKWSNPEKLGPNINTKYWEGSCSISADKKLFYFASERPGGLGGKDIYVSHLQANGEWGPAENLGSAINTPYDDDSPFIHPDGITLFFSSKGHNSIGGYDIMYSIKKDNSWIAPVNMGFPLNTTDDDIYYVLTAKGDKGYYSSTRTGMGEKGSHDIYQVTPGKLGEQPIVAMLKGIVFGNDVPMEAELRVVKLSNGELIGPFKSNKKTGHYLVALSHGEKYNIQVQAPGYPTYSEDLNVANIHHFIEIDKDFHLAKGGYIDPHVDTVKMDDIVKVLDTITSVTYIEPFDTSKTITQPKDTAKIAVTQPKDTTKIVTTQPKDTTKIVAAQPKDTTKIVSTQPKDTSKVVLTGDPCKDFKTLDFSALKKKSLNNPAVYKKLLEIGNRICAKGMNFKVQIAAYKYPDNYKWKHLEEFGDPERQKLDDGITRITQGNFVSILDAEKQRQKAISKGQTDAWITGFIDGKRFTLEELIMVDFYNKNIAAFEKNYRELEEVLAQAEKEEAEAPQVMNGDEEIDEADSVTARK